MDAEEFALLFAQGQRYENVEVPVGEMSPRERFLNTMDFHTVDRIIDTEFGYWIETLARWHAEGLPAYVDNNNKADLYFGFDRWQKHVPVRFGIWPPFKMEVILDDGVHQLIYNSERVKCQVFSNGKDSIPHYLEFPIKDAASYRALFKEHLAPQIEKRITVDLAEIGQQVRDRNYVLTVVAGSTAGKIRNWMGFEGICLALYDQPELLDEILADMEEMMCALATAVTEHIAPDLAQWWEDIAYKSGPIVTPRFFNENCGRVIGRVMDIYRKAGCRFSFVDCDGDFRRLLPGWMNNGVNIMFPLEVAAGVHPLGLRREHPGMRMMGGVDKTVLTKGRDAIKKELLALKPLVEEGGFIPHVDHRVQADVSLRDYLYYLDVKRDLFGIPNKVNE